MIVGIGTDAVEIKRFEHWSTYTQKKLKRIFSEEEISYSLKNKCKSAERFAARFAAKEAFYKAISHAQQPKTLFNFISMCPHVYIKNKNNIPHLCVTWEKIGPEQKQYKAHLSVAHTGNMAIAFVVLELASFDKLQITR